MNVLDIRDRDQESIQTDSLAFKDNAKQRLSIPDEQMQRELLGKNDLREGQEAARRWEARLYGKGAS